MTVFQVVLPFQRILLSNGVVNSSIRIGFLAGKRLAVVLLVELEVLGLLLGHVGQVHDGAHQIGLHAVIALVVIIINDEVSSVGHGSIHILEHITVQWIAQDVVRVDALEGRALRLGRVAHLLVRFVRQDLHALQVLARVLLFFDCPLAVFRVDGGEVGVDGLVDVDGGDADGGAALFDAGHDELTEPAEEQSQEEHGYQGEGGERPAGSFENILEHVAC